MMVSRRAINTATTTLLGDVKEELRERERERKTLSKRIPRRAISALS